MLFEVSLCTAFLAHRMYYRRALIATQPMVDTWSGWTVGPVAWLFHQ